MSTVEIESEIKRERERERDTEYRGIGRVSVKAVLWLLIAGPVSVSPRRVSAWHSASMVLAAGVRLSERQQRNNLPVPLTAFSPALLLSYPHTLCICCRAAVVACRPFASHRIQPALQRLSLGAHTRRRRPLFTRTRRP
jgi:hypothetical protein